MLLLAWLLFIGWIILMLAVVSAHGFAGPAFWSMHAVLLLGVIAWLTHFTRQRRRPEMPDGYSVNELVLLCVFVILIVGGMGTCAGVQGYVFNQHHRLLRTEADMRRIATAWEAWATDVNAYNAAGAAVTIPRGGYPGAFGNQPITLRYTFGSDTLAPVLAPTYIKIFPRTDGWGHDWQFATDEPFPRGNGDRAQIYMIRSAGANGRFDPIVSGNITDYDCDIVYSNGVFISR
jgi:hypothetical protein